MTTAVTALPSAEVLQLNEDQAREFLQDLRAPYRVPADWWGDDNEVLAFTHDPVLAALAADFIARADTGGSYLSLAGGGVVVEGPLALVLVDLPILEGELVGLVDVRPAGPGDDYVVTACRVRPAGPYREPTEQADLALADVVLDAGKLLVELDAEDAAEDAGVLRGDDRRTCHKCREWATEQHVASDRHVLATCRRPCCASSGRRPC